MTTATTSANALLVLDMQKVLVSRMDARDITGPIQRAVDHARKAGTPVIFVRLAFRAGHPEIVRSNPAFAAAVEHSLFVDSDEGTQLHGEIGWQDDDVVVTKRRVSAFAGSDLAEVLRGFGASHIVLCGIATSGVVLSTAREAADRDLRVSVLRDACKDPEPDVHDFLMDRILPRSASVTTVDAWASET